MSEFFTNLKKMELKFKSNRQNESIPLDKIEYIEVYNRKCHIHINKLDEPLTTYAKLSELEKQLNDSFIKVNRSCIVSLNYIKSIRNETIVLKNDIEVLPSKALFSQIFNDYDRFVANKSKITTPVSFIKILFDSNNIPKDMIIKYKNGTSVKFNGDIAFNI
jgi:hypothetical protein